MASEWVCNDARQSDGDQVPCSNIDKWQCALLAISAECMSLLGGGREGGRATCLCDRDRDVRCTDSPTTETEDFDGSDFEGSEAGEEEEEVEEEEAETEQEEEEEGKEEED